MFSEVSGGQCPLPAGVPPLPPGLRITEEMKQLLGALLSPTSVPQIGFCGMGGIGKTTISAWLVRQPQVRENYNQVVWATFGQTPNIQKVQSLVYLQLTGSDNNATEMSDDEVLQSLKQAFAGKTVLLVLDDVWEAEHTGSVCCIDDSTQSRVLISSRVRSVLDGGDIVDISLPSDADAIQILLNEAGFNVLVNGAPPKEALEVVQFCKKLPLAIGIAGALLKNMGLDTDWSEVLAVLKEEFGQGGQVRAMENSVISISLTSIKGRQRDQVIQLFCGFALVPEDTFCPLEVLGMIFEATTPLTSAGEQTKPTSRLLLRKWLKMLIDRSLVLGSVDKPQLHDIVLEFVIGQFSPEELKEAHRRLIRVFQRERPMPRGWSKMMAHGDHLVTYVTHEVGFHVAKAWSAPWDADTEAIAWTTDLVNGHHDMLSTTAAQHLGVDRMRQMAARAEAEEQWWSAVIWWTQVGDAMILTGGFVAGSPPYRHAVDLITKVIPVESMTTAACTQDDIDRVELELLGNILKSLNPADITKYADRVKAVSSTPTAVADPLAMSMMLCVTWFGSFATFSGLFSLTLYN
jgi:hypothetical protein